MGSRLHVDNIHRFSAQRSYSSGFQDVYDYSHHMGTSGLCCPIPTKYDIDEAELARISKLAKLQLDDATEDLDGARNGTTEETETEDGSEGEENRVALPKSNRCA
jgi:hypothetical protein